MTGKDQGILYSHSQTDPGINRQLIRRLSKYVSYNFKRTINADHVLKLPGLGLFCYYRFIYHISKIIFEILIL